MRRFYKSVGVTASDSGFALDLDGKPLPTPGKKPLRVPSRALADAIAAEWQGQGKDIKPLTMPLMRLASTAIDRLPDVRETTIAEIAAYGGTDLVCYRTQTPAELLARQKELWDPLLAWLRRRYDIHLAATDCVIAIPQGETSLARLRQVVASFDDWRLAALHALTTATGSVVIALAAIAGEVDAAKAYELSVLDELFQRELWGADAEADARREALAADIAASLHFLELLPVVQTA